ncbi:hypothetical protein Q9L58_002280 [Maublancomyces gigas]|uniref:Protein kinase domain-containing protein n=1 Tax=Discina gigas TaxID=1032678 RepID=A0ABR3GS24_9PEZI
MSDSRPSATAFRTKLLERYKLPTEFDGDEKITHTILKSNLQANQRRIKVATTWRRDRMLGAGAFGEVWLQVEEHSGSLRAVKIIPTRQVNLRELESLVELRDHPDLFVSFFGWFTDPYATHIAMEYVPHGDLSQYIEDHGASAKAHREVGEITSQILEGLVVLHDRDICHRDLKPQNILIASPSPIWIKISDFGISKRTSGTSLNTNCGTICYQAPEQMGLLPKKYMKSDSYTKLVDIWALGSIVHEILTAQIPFLEIDLRTPISDVETNTQPMIDIPILFGYCQDGDPFPIDSLENNRISTEGINFVKSLMAVDPGSRATAADALMDPWLVRASCEVQTDHSSQYGGTGKAPAAPLPTRIPPTVASVFNADAVASLVGDRRKQFAEEANARIQAAIIGSVYYGDCNSMLVQFCQSWQLVSDIPEHYPKGYAYWARPAESAKDPLRKLELWANAVEANGEKAHWDRLVVRGLNDLLVSFLCP